MDIKDLQKIVINALEDVKAQDIQLFDTTKLTSLFDRVVVASGTSNRQTRALAASVRDKVKESGGKIVSIEGETTGEWVLVDLGDMVVHIMQPTIRAYYRLEEIWGEKAISLTTAKRSTKKATAASEETGTKPKKTTAKKAAAVTEEAPKKRAVRKAAPVAAEEAPKKRATRKTATTTAEPAATETVAPAKKRAAPRKPAAEGKATATPRKRATKPAAVESTAEPATAAPVKRSRTKTKAAE